MGRPPPRLAIRNERTSVCTSRVFAPDAQAPFAPAHGNPGGADSIASLTIVPALPTWTPFTSSALPARSASLLPTFVPGSYMVGLVRIGLFQPGHPLNIGANWFVTWILKLPREEVRSSPSGGNCAAAGTGARTSATTAMTNKCFIDRASCAPDWLHSDALEFELVSKYETSASLASAKHRRPLRNG